MPRVNKAENSDDIIKGKILWIDEEGVKCLIQLGTMYRLHTCKKNTFLS